LSQYAKRKAKEKAEKEKTLGQELITALDEEITSVEVKKQVEFTAYDIFRNPVTGAYEAAIITYDPINKTAVIESIGKCTRQLSLQFDQQKRALATLIKRSK
jgi:hypothetical protein